MATLYMAKLLTNLMRLEKAQLDRMSPYEYPLVLEMQLYNDATLVYINMTYQ